jgi:hypothetical protein
LSSLAIRYTREPTFWPLSFLVTKLSRSAPDDGVVMPYVFSYSAPSRAQLDAHVLPSGHAVAFQALPV